LPRIELVVLSTAKCLCKKSLANSDSKFENSTIY